MKSWFCNIAVWDVSIYVRLRQNILRCIYSSGNNPIPNLTSKYDLVVIGAGQAQSSAMRALDFKRKFYWLSAAALGGRREQRERCHQKHLEVSREASAFRKGLRIQYSSATGFVQRSSNEAGGSVSQGILLKTTWSSWRNQTMPVCWSSKKRGKTDNRNEVEITHGAKTWSCSNRLCDISQRKSPALSASCQSMRKSWWPVRALKIWRTSR